MSVTPSHQFRWKFPVFSDDAGEMDIDEDSNTAAKKMRSRFGEMLFDRLMDFLTSNKSIWKERMTCVREHVKRPPGMRKNHKQECLTPVGMDGEGRDTRLRVASAGTTCTDVSAFGQMAGLMGPSTEPLALWLAERVLLREDAASLSHAFSCKLSLPP